MRGFLRSLVADERPVSERVLILVIAALGALALGMLLSPFRKTVIGSYNGSYNEGNSAGAPARNKG
ncbi:MAG: hypothetical protein AB7C89_05115 [Intestinibacillus sp.]